MDFLKALSQAQALLDAINMLAKLMQANTEATEKHTAVAQQLLDRQNAVESAEDNHRVA